MQVNVKDHGATGSGVEDETPSFEAALAALPPCGGTLFVPDGTYVIGDLMIGKSIVLQGESVYGGYCTTLLVQDGKNGVVLTADGQGSIVRNLTIRPQNGEGVTSGSLDGILVRGAPGVKIENVLVQRLGGNGIHIYGGPGLISDQWLIENTWTFHCGKNGLLVEGRDSNAGLCLLLNSSGNVEWGVLEQNSFGNTYVACNTSVSGLGSFKVRQLAAGGAETGAANYSTFIGCWTEGGDPADFANAPNILVVGGNLAAFAIGANGARQRVGLGFSKLTFAEATAFGDDQRDFEVRVPEFHPNGYAALTFRYRPLLDGLKTWDADLAAWQDDPYYSVWALQRYTALLGSPDDPAADAYDEALPGVAPSFDRTWLLRGFVPRPAGGDPPAPFGWTERHHKTGGGYFFFGEPVANQRAYWTWEQEVELAPGDNAVEAAPGFPAMWLTGDRRGGRVRATFALEAPEALDFAAGPLPMVSAGMHKILADGRFVVQIHNASAARSRASG